jgi:hypothetical protein
LTAAAIAEQRSVSRVFHPSPVGEHLHLGDGVHAAVLTGSAGYQLSTGEIIEI